MKFSEKKTDKFFQILSSIIGGFSISIACIAVYRTNKNTKLLNKINEELNLRKRLIAINADRWVNEGMMMRQAVREVKWPKAQKRFLTG